MRRLSLSNRNPKKSSLMELSQPRKSIQEQLKLLEDKKTEKHIRKLIDMKTLGEDEFLIELRTGRKKSIL